MTLTDTGENVQKWTRVFFDSALSHTRRSVASEKKKKIACPLLDVFACGQVSSPRLYRFNKIYEIIKKNHPARIYYIYNIDMIFSQDDRNLPLYKRFYPLNSRL